MSLAVLAMLQRFPQLQVYVAEDADPWEVCRTSGFLRVGMAEWLKQHNLTAVVLTGGGYAFRWIAKPEKEREFVQRIFRTAVAAHDNRDYAALKYFQIVATEAGLLEIK